MVLVAMGFLGLWGIILSPGRLSSYPCTHLAWVVTISAAMVTIVGCCGLWGIVLSPDRLSSYPCTHLARVVTVSGMLGIVLSPNRQSSITSPDMVLVKTKLFHSHACFTPFLRVT